MIIEVLFALLLTLAVIWLVLRVWALVVALLLIDRIRRRPGGERIFRRAMERYERYAK